MTTESQELSEFTPFKEAYISFAESTQGIDSQIYGTVAAMIGQLQNPLNSTISKEENLIKVLIDGVRDISVKGADDALARVALLNSEGKFDLAKIWQKDADEYLARVNEIEATVDKKNWLLKFLKAPGVGPVVQNFPASASLLDLAQTVIFANEGNWEWVAKKITSFLVGIALARIVTSLIGVATVFFGIAAVESSFAIVLGIFAFGAAGYLADVIAYPFVDWLRESSPWFDTLLSPRPLNEEQRNVVEIKLLQLFFGKDQNFVGQASNQNEITYIDPLQDFGSFKEVVAKAKNDIAWRYALRELNPFVVEGLNYDLHNQDGSLSLFDPETETGMMTDEWLESRALLFVLQKEYFYSGNTSGLVETALPYHINFVNLLSESAYELFIKGWHRSGDFETREFVFGSSDDDEITGGDGRDRLFGGAGNDVIIGGEDDDYIEGGEGEDDIFGGGDNDTLYGHAGIDYLIGGTGEDKLYGGLGDDTLYAHDEAERTDTSKDELYGGKGEDNLFGDAGDDWLDGGENADTMNGGFGHDTYIIDNVGDVVIEELNGGVDSVLSTITYSLSDNVEDLALIGDEKIDGIGNTLDNKIVGNDQINTIDGGEGADTMAGRGGNDIYIVDNIDDVIVEALDNGIDTVKSTVDHILSDNVEYLVLTGDQEIDGTGNILDNTITGNDQANTIDGGEGADIMEGGLGKDTYVVDSVADVVNEALDGGTDSVLSTITYSLSDNVENLALIGDKSINGTGNTLDNKIIGNVLANIIDGGEGADIMAGGLGDDTYIVDNTGDTVTEAQDSGTDTVKSSVTHTLSANVEHLELTGDQIIDGTGNILDNTITGNGKNNLLDGDEGADTLIGGLGDDTYIVDNTGDTVTETLDSGTDTVKSSVTHTLSANVEHLELTGDQIIDGTGNILDNTITGNDKVNIIDGGEGADTLIGGLGDDIYIVDNTGDTVTETLDSGTDTVKSSVTHTLSANVENLALTGNQAIDGIGNELDNTITGNDQANTLEGGDGYDIYNVDSQDTILDADGKGHVVLNGQTLTHGKREEDDPENTYKSGNNTYVLNGSTLTVNGGLTINNYSNGDLGISLNEIIEPDLPPPTPPPLPALPRSDPLSLDLNADGLITTLSIEEGVHFDLDNSGFAEETSWVAPEDGLLTLDRNQNGIIDGGAELFGTETLLSNGHYARNGFTALADFDSNGDNVINAEDEIFNDLRVWQDTNSNGVSEEGELVSLQDLNIASINTDYDTNIVTDVNNVQHREKSTFTYTDDAIGLTNTLWFDSETRNSIPVDILNGEGVIISTDILALPDAVGFGNAYSLHQAMALDESGRLTELVSAFVNEDDAIVRQQLVSEMLVLWTGQEGVDPASRGSSINGQQLGVVETFWGKSALQNNPNGTYAEQVSEVYQGIAASVYTQLMSHSRLANLVSLVTFSEVNSSWTADYSKANTYLVELFNLDDSTKQTQLADFFTVIEGVNPYSNTLINLLVDSLVLSAESVPATRKDDWLSVALQRDNILSGTEQADDISSFAGEDTLYGLGGDDTLDGGEGVDRVYGGTGDDTLSGGVGVGDYLSGDAGSDVYLFRAGDGHTTINNYATDEEGQDILRFDASVTVGNVTATRSNNDLRLTLTSSGEVITVTNHFNSNANYELNEVEFADGTVWDTAYIRDAVLVTTEGADAIQGYAEAEVFSGLGGNDNIKGGGGNDTIFGGEGNDSVYGNTGDDIVTGDAGNDYVYGNEGDDTLMGGDGTDRVYGGTGDDTLSGGIGVNDYLSGEAGSDVYLFSAGDGNTTIYNYATDEEGQDTLRFDASVIVGDVATTRYNNDLRLTLTSTGEVITVTNHFNSNVGYELNEVEFADGTVWSNAHIKQAVLLGTEGVDAIQGYVEAEVLSGLGGNDNIRGGGGNDTISGDAGDDVLDGNEGNDILTGGEGRDWIYGGAGDDILSGGLGVNDSLSGEEGSDVYLFSVGDGNTSINNYTTDEVGQDTLRFDASVAVNDVTATRYNNDLRLTLASSGEVVSVSNHFNSNVNYELDEVEFADGTVWDSAYIREAVLVTTEGVDVIQGYAEAEVFSGLGGNDIIRGGGGNDTIFGGEGHDSVYGDEGDDSLLGDAGNDSIYGNKGNDSISGGEDDDSLYGNAGNDTLSGDEGVDRIYGDVGDDIISGGLGNDYLNGGSGNDNYYFAQGDGQDIIDDNEGDMIIYVSGLNPLDATFRRSDVDLLITFTGNTEADSITLVDWFDPTTFVGSSGIYIGAEGGELQHISASQLEAATLKGSEGDDQLWGNIEDNIITGLEGNDDLYGLAGNDSLDGGTGDDQLFGGEGNDALTGGLGNDELLGGNGDDSYYYQKGDGSDVITDSTGTEQLIMPDYRFEELVFRREGEDLIIFDNSEEAARQFIDDGTVNILLRIKNQFDDTTTAPLTAIEHFVFQDDHRLSVEDISVQVLLGTALDDSIQGHVSSDIINAGSGDDVVEGGAGEDIIAGDEGQDVLNGGQGDDQLLGGEGDDTLTDSLGNNALYGGSGNDILVTGVGHDVLFGGEGQDTLTGNDGDDVLNGGADNDVLLAGEGNDTLTGGTGNDQLSGGHGDDSYYYNKGDGNDVISDTGGTDQLVMADYAIDDLVFRREGNDLIIFDKNDAAIRQLDSEADADVDILLRVENQFYDTAEVSATAIDTFVFNNNETLNFSDISVQVLLGSELDDVIQGHTNNDTINAGNGDDVVEGGAGDDVIAGDEGDDALNGGTGDDQLFGGEGDDLLDGDTGDDIVYGDAGNDELNGGWGDDQLFGGDGDDTLFGYIGDDQLLAGAGNDTLLDYYGHNVLEGGAGDDTLTTGDGDDSLFGDDGQDVLEAGDGDDYLEGGAGNDTLSGGGGVDVLVGGSGDDTLIASESIWDTSENALTGGAGDDTLYGSSGDDTYYFNLGDGQDSLIETKVGEAFSNITPSTDKIVFGAGITATDIGFIRKGEHLIIKVGDADDQITVQSWYKEPSDHFKINTIEFADASSLSVEEIESKVIYQGTDEGETLSGYRELDDEIQAGSGDDKVFGREGDDHLFGGAGDDYLDGDEGNDVIEGGAGRDNLVGRTGDDQLAGGLDADSLSGNEGDDFLYGEDGDDSLFGGDGQDSLFGGTDNDYLDGGAGDDTLSGGEGDDQLGGGLGNDSMNGGLGSNKFVINDGEGHDIINVTGGATDGILFGEGLTEDRLTFTREADDLLIAIDDGTAQTVIITDHFAAPEFELSYVQPYGTYQISAANIAQIVASAGTDVESSEGINDFDSVVEGDALDNQLLGDNNTNLLQGHAGNDTLFSFAGNDTLQGGAGNDALYGGNGSGVSNDGDDTLEGGAGNDLLFGEQGNDTLLGGEGDDSYYYAAKGGVDSIVDAEGGQDGIFFVNGITAEQLSFHRTGDDLIILVDGDLAQQVVVKDHFLGGDNAISYIQPTGGFSILASEIEALLETDSIIPEDDTNTPITNVDKADFDSVVEGDALDNQLLGDNNTNLLQGHAGNDTLFSFSGNDTLQGGAGNDALYGGNGSGVSNDGDDTLEGGAGNDLLFGEQGHDTLLGGEGDDSYYYAAKGGVDSIVDAEGGQDGIFFVNGITAEQLSFHRTDDDLIILVDGDLAQQVVVKGHFLGGDNAISYVQPTGGFSILASQIGALLVNLPTETESEIIGGETTPVDDSSVDDVPVDDIPVNNGETQTENILGGDDTISGSNANEIVLGGAGNDVLSGGQGNDLLIGGAGDDTYLFGAGDGEMVIRDSEGINILRFTGDITFNQVGSGLRMNNDDLVLAVNGGPDQVTVEDFFSVGSQSLTAIEFESGGSITAAQLFSVFGIAMPVESDQFATYQNGDNTANILIGDNANDYVAGFGGDDTLQGGKGDDLLEGGRGNDTYLFAAGDGQDTINNAGGGLDTLRFTGSIGFSDVASGILRSNDDLILQVSGTSDQVTINDFFLGGHNVIDIIEFESGQSLTADQIFGVYGLSNPDSTTSPDYGILPNAFLYGTVTTADSSMQTIIGSSDADMIDAGAGNDVLRGNHGNDYLIGGQGNDKYEFTLGDGQDTINNFSNIANETDQLSFSEGIVKDDLWFTRNEDDLIIDISGTKDNVTVDNWFVDDVYQIDEIHVGNDVLLNTNVDSLISAMASFDNPAADSMSISTLIKDEISPVITAAWADNTNL